MWRYNGCNLKQRSLFYEFKWDDFPPASKDNCNLFVNVLHYHNTANVNLIQIYLFDYNTVWSCVLLFPEERREGGSNYLNIFSESNQGNIASVQLSFKKFYLFWDETFLHIAWYYSQKFFHSLVPTFKGIFHVPLFAAPSKDFELLIENSERPSAHCLCVILGV